MGQYREIILLALLVAGCSARPYESIDPDLKPAYESFLAASVSQNHDLTAENNIIVEYGDAAGTCGGGDDSGCCLKQDNQTPRVVIATYVKNLSEDEKEMILFHELGHCLLNRDHESTQDSLMYPYVAEISPRSYESNHDAYMKELFK